MNETQIRELAEELAQNFSEQSKEDTRAKEAVLQMGMVDAKEGDVKPVGAAHDPLVYKQKFWFLSSVPYLRVNAPPKMKEHAEKLENGLEGIWLLSQGAVDVWRHMTKGADWSGRGWSKIVTWPGAWGGWEQGDEDDEAYNDRLELLKAENFPILWKPVESEHTWPTHDARGNLDEVVEIRQMTSRAARKEYGDILSGQWGEREKIKVIEYTDDKECVTILVDKGGNTGSPVEAKRWEHGMGVNPYVCIELEPTPPSNDRGIKWAGCSFDGRHARPVIDSIITDALSNFRRATRAPDEFYLDKETTEGNSPEAAASARKIKIEPDGQMFWWTTERHERPQPGQTNEDGWKILQILLAGSRDLDISDTLKGELLNDVTGIGYNTAGQLAQKQFDPTIENFKRGAKNVGLRFCRAIKSFAKEFEGIKDAPTDIPIVYASADGTYSLSLSPKDVEGWENRIQPRLELAIPVNENGQITVARLATAPDNPLMDIPQAQSRYMGIENTQETNKAIIRDAVRRALVPKFVNIISEQGLKLVSAPSGDLGDLESVFAAFSPAEKAALLRLAQSQGIQTQTNPAPSLSRGPANANRTGMAQQPTGARMNDGQSY